MWVGGGHEEGWDDEARDRIDDERVNGDHLTAMMRHSSQYGLGKDSSKAEDEKKQHSAEIKTRSPRQTAGV